MRRRARQGPNPLLSAILVTVPTGKRVPPLVLNAAVPGRQIPGMVDSAANAIGRRIPGKEQQVSRRPATAAATSWRNRWRTF